MANYLVIVESPAKAKTIKKYLGKGYSVVASMGHVRDLPKSKMGIDIDDNFRPDYVTIRGKGDLLSKLKKEAKDSDKVILATDPDREGEAISWHLMHALNIDQSKTTRVVFNEITKSAVQSAIKNPRSINQNLVDAQQARRVLDRLVGYKISPLLWRKVKKGLSAGRVQSVSTRLICDRENEINAFEPKEYWSITANLLKGQQGFKAMFYGTKKNKIELSNEQQTNEVLESIQNAEFIVDEVKRSKKKRQPAPPFITSTLQQEASRKLGFTSIRTMQAAQQLYEGIEIKGYGAIGLITYMRTDSTRIADEAMQQAKDYIEGKYGKEYLPEAQRVYKNKKNAQDAHEAIRPTAMDLEPAGIKESLTNDQFKLYKLIWDRFIASQMAAAQYDNISADIAAASYIFRATGSKLDFQGFMAVYIEGKDIEDEEGEQILPALEKTDKLKKKSIAQKQHFTQPPPRYTEATLIKALEEEGIGRPSTYAPTITTIISRGYVIREKKQLIPTELGMVVTDLMREHFKDIVNVEFTANMEQQLDEVEEGDRDWVDIIRRFYGPFDEVMKEADSKIGHIELKPVVSDVPCDKCGKLMVIRDGRFGKFLACPGFPNCRNTKPIVEETDLICPKCSGKIVVKKTGKGRKYHGCENNPKCDFMTWDTPTEEKCPECGGMLLKKGARSKNPTACYNKDCGFNK